MRRLSVVVLLMCGLAAGCATADSGEPDGATSPTADARSASDGALPPSDATPNGSITLSAPNGGEIFEAGELVTIGWTSDGTVSAVDIELHKGGVKVADIVQDAANLGTFGWTVPADLPHGNDYTVLISASAVPSINDESNASFTVSNWRYRAAVIINATSNETDYPILLELAPSNFNYAGAAADGSDLRFATTQTHASGFDVPHWIESWNPGGVSRVWVRVPVISTSVSSDIFAFYGNPYASSTSSETATLPNQYTSTDGATLSTGYTVDVFRVQAGHTVYVPDGSAVTVNARLIDVAGTIDGTGLGYSGGDNSSGGGSGGGGSSTSAGGGGGGHGGTGGRGGYDSGDTYGSGGSTYGSSTSSTSVGMGAGGGGTDTSIGGDGGGAITMRGRYLSVSGAIRMDGTAGAVSGRCGGGGAGGGVLLVGYIVDATGTLSAHGGDGGNGTITANDGGGGGGGGRLKVFYQDRITNTLSMDVGGGAGGGYGDVSSGVNGNTGSTRVSTASTGEPTYTMGNEQSLF